MVMFFERNERKRPRASLDVLLKALSVKSLSLSFKSVKEVKTSRKTQKKESQREGQSFRIAAHLFPSCLSFSPSSSSSSVQLLTNWTTWTATSSGRLSNLLLINSSSASWTFGFECEAGQKEGALTSSRQTWQPPFDANLAQSTSFSRSNSRNAFKKRWNSVRSGGWIESLWVSIDSASWNLAQIVSSYSEIQPN